MAETLLVYDPVAPCHNAPQPTRVESQSIKFRTKAPDQSSSSG